MAQRAKDPARSLLWHGFETWPGNFRMPWVQPNEKKIKTRQSYNGGELINDGGRGQGGMGSMQL